MQLSSLHLSSSIILHHLRETGIGDNGPCQITMATTRAKARRSGRTLEDRPAYRNRAERAQYRDKLKRNQERKAAKAKAKATLSRPRQTSQLLNLPAEVRNLIYDLILYAPPDSKPAKFLDLGALRPPLVSQTCKILRAETLPMFAASLGGQAWSIDFDPTESVHSLDVRGKPHVPVTKAEDYLRYGLQWLYECDPEIRSSTVRFNVPDIPHGFLRPWWYGFRTPRPSPRPIRPVTPLLRPRRLPSGSSDLYPLEDDLSDFSSLEGLSPDSSPEPEPQIKSIPREDVFVKVSDGDVEQAPASHQYAHLGTKQGFRFKGHLAAARDAAAVLRKMQAEREGSRVRIQEVSEVLHRYATYPQ